MNITIVRNTTQTLSFTATGDYSGDTVKFTLKADKTLTSSRLIDKDASVSYSAPVSTITVSLLPTDSASLGSDMYYFDLRVENSTTDKEVITSGIVYIDKSVRNTTDGLTSELTEFTVAELDPTDYTDEVLFSDGTDWSGKSASELKTLLGLPSKVYKAFINCNGEVDPTPTVAKNTFTTSITLARASTGTYTMTLTDEFTADKTIINATVASDAEIIRVYRVTSSILAFITYDSDGVAADSVDFYLSVEVY